MAITVILKGSEVRTPFTFKSSKPLQKQYIKYKVSTVIHLLKVVNVLV